MWQPGVVALLGFIASVCAAPSITLQQVKRVPPGWSFHSHAKTSDSITLFVALKEPGIGALKSELDDRQSAAHPSFGQHLSHDEVVRYRQPAAAAAQAVTSWLQAGGAGNVRPQGSLLSFEATAQTLKTLLGADVAYYGYNGSDSAPVLRALSYKIPAGLLDYVDFIHPLTSFIPPRARSGNHRRPQPKPTKPGPNSGSKAGSKPGVADSSAPASQPSASPTLTTSTSTSTSATQDLSPTPPCFAETVPDCIKELYNITYAPSTPNPTPVRLGIAGFLEQWIEYADVSAFLTTFAPSLPASAANFTIETVNNGTAPQSPSGIAGLEASLDVEYALALTTWAAANTTTNTTTPSSSINMTYYSTGGRGTKLNPSTGQPVDSSSDDNEPYLPFLEYLLAKPDDEVPHVLSISYADDEPSVPQAYATRVCDMFAALAARGCTILVATGDGGAAGTGGTQCVRQDTNSSSSTPNLLKRLVPTFPASCPYVTAVGATDNVGPPLTAADFSAGGFSDYFPRPSWQDAVVQPYLASLLVNTTSPSPSTSTSGTATSTPSATNPSPTLYNTTGRATPDLSAIGANFQVLAGGSVTSLLGTSASTPVVAAMISLINDARLRAGKASLGWLNPVLYSAAVRGVLVDVTEGGSVGCVFPDGTGTVGWAAREGFDAVTGLGVVGGFGEILGALGAGVGL